MIVIANIVFLLWVSVLTVLSEHNVSYLVCIWIWVYTDQILISPLKDNQADLGIWIPFWCTFYELCKNEWIRVASPRFPTVHAVALFLFISILRYRFLGGEGKGRQKSEAAEYPSTELHVVILWSYGLNYYRARRECIL